MSSALAISGVTATLQYYLNIVYNNPGAVLGSVSVSALAPDLVQGNLGAGSNGQLQVNLFLHQVTANAAWRNVGFPALDADGSTRLSAPPLALDLHYLLTVYASEDSLAEALLGYAVLLLHENPVLTRAQIQTALGSLPATNPLSGVLSASGLADQFEMLKMTPSTLNREELAWIWTALKADYRPTFPFQVSVVLIEPERPTAFALPVLSRNLSVSAGPPTGLVEALPPAGQSAPAPGDTVTISGTGLAGATTIILSNPRLGITYPPIAPTTVTDAAISFVVPNDPANLPAGVYNLAVFFTNGGGDVTRATNPIPLAVAPRIVGAPTVTANVGGLLVTVTSNPQVRPNQSIALALGATAVPAPPFAAPTATLGFPFPALAAGPYLARLRVDGVESPVAVDWTATPPTFTGPFVTVP